MLWIGALYLAASGPLMAQTMGLNASTSLSEPCSSAKAVHDMRCANYTGFKPRRPSDGRDLQRGMASWYGPGFHGRLTANGERFDMNELTAAHKTLPFGTRVLGHNPRPGQEGVVRINDRGPFIKGRMIDLSKAAAKALGFKSRGHDAVVLREVLPARANGELVASGRDS